MAERQKLRCTKVFFKSVQVPKLELILQRAHFLNREKGNVSPTCTHNRTLKNVIRRRKEQKKEILKSENG